MLSRLSIAYSTFSFLSVFLSLTLLPRHIQVRDAGLLLVSFLSIVNFLYGLNTVAFTGVTLLTHPIYCDIGMSRINQITFITTSFNTNPTFKSNEHNATVAKLLIGVQILFPFTLLCYALTFHGWIDQMQTRNSTIKRRMFRKSEHHTLHFVVLLIFMVMSEFSLFMRNIQIRVNQKKIIKIYNMYFADIIAQDHRFDVIEGVGCVPSMTFSFVGWVLTWGLPLFMCCGTCTVLCEHQISLYNIIRCRC